MASLVVCQEQSDYSVLEDRTGDQPRCRVAAPDLQAILRRLVERYGTQTALARAIQITDSRLAKVLKGESGSLSVLNCLRLAKVTGLSPSQILEAAGKSDIAVLIEDMYGDTAQARMDTEEAVKQFWPEMSPKAKDLLKGFLDEVAHKKRKRRKKR